jgi:hypothetical protein
MSAKKNNTVGKDDEQVHCGGACFSGVCEVQWGVESGEWGVMVEGKNRQRYAATWTVMR